MSKNTKTIPNHWKIDSFRVEVLSSQLEISPLLRDKYKLLNESTGEVTELMSFQKKKMIEHSENGITYKTYLYSRFSQETKQLEEYLVFLVNAKMLHSQYFEGITDKTIKIVYDRLSDLHHFKISFEDFLNCYVYDIDFCRDFSSDYDTFRWWTEKYTYIDNIDVKKYVKDDVCETLQFNHRDKGKPNYPYAKFYSKFHESRQPKTRAFYNQNDINFNDLYEIYRFEFTIKSSTACSRWLGTKFNTLSNYLNFINNHNQITKVAEDIHKIYIGELKIVVEPNDYKSIPMLLEYILITGYHLGKKFNTIERELNEYLQPMSERTRQRIIAQLKRIYLTEKEVVRYQPYQEERITNMLKGIFS